MAAELGTFIIDYGGSSIAVDCYLSDTANARVNFASGGVAGANSETFFKSPANGMIVDFSVATGTANVTALQVTINNAPSMSILRLANHLNTLNNRPKLSIPIHGGELLGGIQLA